MKLEALQHFVSSSTMAAVESFHFEKLTEIQHKALRPLLEGNDLRGTAKTGSGKTLAFLIPSLELLHRAHFPAEKGTAVLILSPTRELAMQTHSIAEQLLNAYTKNGGFRHFCCTLICGGKKKAWEAEQLKKGMTVLVATPGRLLDHLNNTVGFTCDNLLSLILDEADKMLDKHFEDVMVKILKLLPKNRQTMLFSATKNSKANELVSVALKENFMDVDLTAQKESVTVESLKQCYVVCPLEKKFLLLRKIIASLRDNKKIMVFFSSCDAVRFYAALLLLLQEDVLCIHGKQKQEERNKVFSEFCKRKTASLLCTDIAARGWDIPDVDFVLQYDAPLDPKEYIHRVGRTARGDKSGESLLFLREEEISFISCLQQKKVYILEQQVNAEALNCNEEQECIEKVIREQLYLKFWSARAWKTTVEAYTFHKRKDIFNIFNLDLRKLATSFGRSEPPNMDIAFEFKKSTLKKLKRKIRDGFYADAYENEESEPPLKHKEY